MKLACENCGYYWKEADEERACCHRTSRCPDDTAPCEYDDTDFCNDCYDYGEEFL